MEFFRFKFLITNQCVRDCSVNSLKGKLAHKKRFKGAGGGKMKIDHKSDMCNWMWYKSDHTCVDFTKFVQTLKPTY